MEASWDFSSSICMVLFSPCHLVQVLFKGEPPGIHLMPNTKAQHCHRTQTEKKRKKRKPTFLTGQQAPGLRESKPWLWARLRLTHKNQEERGSFQGLFSSGKTKLSMPETAGASWPWLATTRCQSRSCSNWSLLVTVQILESSGWSNPGVQHLTSSDDVPTPPPEHKTHRTNLVP